MKLSRRKRRWKMLARWRSLISNRTYEWNNKEIRKTKYRLSGRNCSRMDRFLAAVILTVHSGHKVEGDKILRKCGHWDNCKRKRTTS